ncbi:MAG TPA: hypothetical protein VEK79_12560 [Thermoanaerobaculia bacterium]|nr:hypothetical protein [Thermoanaerobaculia bacterium]
MRTLAATWLVSLTSLIATAQPLPPDKPVEAAPKPAWKWTLDERIAKRLDPAAIRERTVVSERDDVERDGFTPEVRASVGILFKAPTRFVVEGHRDPELFLPFELFNSIIRGVEEPDNRSFTRRLYSDEIRESGWDENFFWQTLEEATAEYWTMTDERLAMQRKAETLPLAERRALLIRTEALSISGCRLRAEALQEVRQKLGAEAFDRFLYERVAPNVGIGSDFPFGNEEWRLRYIEGGCR